MSCEFMKIIKFIPQHIIATDKFFAKRVKTKIDVYIELVNDYYCCIQTPCKK